MPKKIYFLSDMHLGAATFADPLDKERRVVRFLDAIKDDAEAIYLLGDVIDYWFEFRHVVPRGFTRFLGKLGELTDRGIEVHWFTGNHDIWIFDYVPHETGVIVHHEAEIVTLLGHRFYLAHGDGLGDDSLGYRLMTGFFHSSVAQTLFSWIHPDLTTGFAYWWSKKSRLAGGKFPEYLGEDKERMVIFAKRYLAAHPEAETTEATPPAQAGAHGLPLPPGGQPGLNFIFGHRHIMLDLMLTRHSRLMILGDWITHNSYAVYDGTHLWMDQFEPDESGLDVEQREGVSIAL